MSDNILEAPAVPSAPAVEPPVENQPSVDASASVGASTNPAPPPARPTRASTSTSSSPRPQEPDMPSLKASPKPSDTKAPAAQSMPEPSAPPAAALKANDSEKKPARTHGRHSAKGGAEIVGRRITVWWPDDERFYRGHVTAWDGQGKHTVKYDDSDEEALDLSKQRYKLLPDLPQPKKEEGGAESNRQQAAKQRQQQQPGQQQPARQMSMKFKLVSKPPGVQGSPVKAAGDPNAAQAEGDAQPKSARPMVDRKDREAANVLLGFCSPAGEEDTPTPATATPDAVDLMDVDAKPPHGNGSEPAGPAPGTSAANAALAKEALQLCDGAGPSTAAAGGRRNRPIGRSTQHGPGQQMGPQVLAELERVVQRLVSVDAWRQGEVDAVTAERESLKGERDGLRAERDALLVEQCALKAEVKRAEAARDAAFAQRDAAEKEAREASAQLAAERGVAASAALDAAALRAQLEALRGDVARCSAESAQMLAHLREACAAVPVRPRGVAWRSDGGVEWTWSRGCVDGGDAGTSWGHRAGDRCAGVNGCADACCKGAPGGAAPSCGDHQRQQGAGGGAEQQEQQRRCSSDGGIDTPNEPREQREGGPAAKRARLDEAGNASTGGDAQVAPSGGDAGDPVDSVPASAKQAAAVAVLQAGAYKAHDAAAATTTALTEAVAAAAKHLAAEITAAKPAGAAAATGVADEGRRQGRHQRKATHPSPSAISGAPRAAPDKQQEPAAAAYAGPELRKRKQPEGSSAPASQEEAAANGAAPAGDAVTRTTRQSKAAAA